MLATHSSVARLQNRRKRFDKTSNGVRALRHMLLFALIPLVIRPSVQAASYTVVWGGNCNNWIPHGWAETDWQGLPTTSDGSVHGQLVQTTSAGDKLRIDKTNTINSQGTGNADVDLYWGYTSIGPWYEQSWHWAPFFSGVQYRSKGISC